MAKYLSPEARKKRTRRRRARKLAMYASLAVFVLVLSYGIVALIEAFSPGEEPPQELLPTATPTDMKPNTDVQNEGEWYTRVGPVKQTINDFDVISPDHRMFQLPENGSVDLSYFEDAVFVGDSLTEGLREYASIENSIANIATFISAKNQTPKSFLEGVIVFPDNYRPTQNGVEAIVSENPGKLYITLGTNALTFMNREQLIYYYDQLLTTLQEQLPDTTFYICSITPTTVAEASRRPVFIYDAIYAANNEIAMMASLKGMHYINLHEVLAGDDGYLKPEYAYSDGIHLKPETYTIWIQYLMSHTVHNPENPYIPGSPYYLG
ncbi:MAG: hypothetical protein IKA10_05845 [Oscillospiraceae bacterium]|nr:hypothetical protein [Oscillospiraceae bacterium]